MVAVYFSEPIRINQLTQDNKVPEAANQTTSPSIGDEQFANAQEDLVRETVVDNSEPVIVRENCGEPPLQSSPNCVVANSLPYLQQMTVGQGDQLH